MHASIPLLMALLVTLKPVAALHLTLHPAHLAATSSQLTTQLQKSLNGLTILNTSIATALANSNSDLQQRINALEKALTDSRNLLLSIYSDSIVQLNTTTYYCPAMNNQVKQNIANTLSSIDSNVAAIRQATQTQPNSSITAFSQQAANLNNLIGQDLNQPGQVTSTTPVKVNQPNLISSNWVATNPNLDELAKIYAPTATQYPDMCPLQTPFVNSQGACMSCPNYYDVTTKTCVNCDRVDPIKHSCISNTSPNGSGSATTNTNGTNGTSGTTGTNGTSGTSGTSGTTSSNGTAGTNGSAGTNGTSGVNGTSGTTNTNGGATTPSNTTNTNNTTNGSTGGTASTNGTNSTTNGSTTGGTTTPANTSTTNGSTNPNGSNTNTTTSNTTNNIPPPAQRVNNLSNNTALLLPSNTTLPQYIAALQSNPTNANLLPCPISTPFFDGTACISCPNNQYFSAQIKTCQTCPSQQVYNPFTYHCDSIRYYSNPTNLTWVSVGTAPSSIKQANAQTAALPNGKPCPLSAPFFNANQCIACVQPKPLFSYDSLGCTACSSPSLFDSNLQSCVTPLKRQTNPSTAPNLIFQGRSLNEWKYYYVNNANADPSLEDCPAAQPHFDGYVCLLCPSDAPYFNLQFKACQKCSLGNEYDAAVKECLSTSGNIVTQQPTLAKMAAGIFA